MGLQIEDGTGLGYMAKVNDENKLETNAVSEPSFLYHNHEEGNAYVWNFPSYDAGAGDTVMFIRNDSNDPLHIHHIYLYTDNASLVTVHTISDGEVPAGTAVTGVNINRMSGNVALATAKQNETGNVGQGTILQTEYAESDTPLTLLKEDGYEIILGKNDCIAIDLVTASTAVTFGHIVGYFHD